MERHLPSDPATRDPAELRCLHELARQLLPLATPREVARDGLLCIAGITGIGAGAVLWRRDERGPLELLSSFGLGPVRLRLRYRIPAEALQPFANAAIALDAARRRAGGRALIEALEPLASRIGEAWLLVLPGESRPRGLLLLGRSLVTDALAGPPEWLADLAEVLRLGLAGRSATLARPESAGEVRARPVRGATHTGASSGSGATARGVAACLRGIRRQHPEATQLVGESQAVLALLEELVSLASTDYTVLIDGETGTGKELAARLLHRLSRRAAGPFEAVDCSSIPQELIESELFGHVKGAFTGATRDFRGAFERADGGTLLLDEVGDMDLRSQTRLLRVLQEGSVRRLGGDRPVPVDVRVVAASNRDLAEMVRQGRFREDLYYRIHVCLLHLPPLRERGDDRLVLFEHAMRQHARELGRAPRTLLPESRRRLRAEAFPGNVRQLQNVVRQLLVQGSGRGTVPLSELERVLERSAVGVRPRGPTSAGGRERFASHEAGALARPVEPVDAAAASQGWARGGTAAAAPEAIEPVAPSSLPVVTDVGAWVLEKLREHRFNLRAAAAHLQLLRRLGASRAGVPVFDRGALDYYLRGEFYQRLVAGDFEVDAVLLQLAGSPSLLPRLRRKVRAYVRQLPDPRDEGWQAELRRRHRRLPERYGPDLERAAQALRAGRWSAP